MLKKSEISHAYTKENSITDYLPWRDYNDEHQIFLLEDNRSLGVCFELTPIPCEARPVEMMQAISKSIGEALKNSIPLEKNHPWILQVFALRESDLSSSMEAIENYFSEDRKQSPLTQAHLKTLKTHFEYMTTLEGVFVDRQVTNHIFCGGLLKVYAVLYRRLRDAKKYSRSAAVEDILRVSRKFSDQLQACGVKVKRMVDRDFYQWMIRWFNPSQNKDEVHLSREYSFPAAHEKPFGWDLTENIFFSSPQSFEEGWLFNGLPHKVMTIQSLTANPAIGHLSAERKKSTDDKVFNLMDHCPEGSVFSMSMVLQAQSEVELHLKIIHDSAVGHHAFAVAVKKDVEQGFESIAHGDYCFPVSMALYLRGHDLEDLKKKQSEAEVLFNSNGFKVITDDELFPVDAYLRYLPMCYDFDFDRKYCYRSKYILLSDIAKLLPVYGRSRGTEHPGFIGFNRGGEPWFYDLFQDKTKNAHFLLLGETGTGKSNLLNFLAMHMLALYNPRFFIIEAGGSFDLFADYCAHLGLTVNKVKIDPKHPISLNPFAQGLKILDQIAQLDEIAKQRFLEKTSQRLDGEILNNKKENQSNAENQKLIIPEQDEESRDILGDMVLAALVMITGGEKKEEDRITRSDRMLIMDAIIDAAQFVKNQQRAQMIASDLIDAFMRLVQQLDPIRESDKIKRSQELADSLRYFTKDPVSSVFFNTPGTPWPLADITLIDFGLFAQEGYEAQRSIAFAGCVSKMLTLAEANQASNRAIISIFDENHLFSKLPLLAAIETRIAKMGRKLGLWIWLATQNLKDFADEARKMLSLIETWMCLALPPDEIDQIEKFKVLTPEQRSLFLSARKEKGKYTEGVLLSPVMQGLFKNIPPKPYLVMAATEQEEKYQRKKLMHELNKTELEVIEYLAEEMMKLPVLGLGR